MSLISWPHKTRDASSGLGKKRYCPKDRAGLLTSPPRGLSSHPVRDSDSCDAREVFRRAFWRNGVTAAGPWPIVAPSAHHDLPFSCPIKGNHYPRIELSLKLKE